MEKHEISEEEILDILGGKDSQPKIDSKRFVLCRYPTTSTGPFCYATPQEIKDDCAGKNGSNVADCKYLVNEIG